MIEQEITVVLAGDLGKLIPAGIMEDPSINIIYCNLDAVSLIRTSEHLEDLPYVLLLPATNLGLKLCSIAHRRYPSVPVVLVGESEDREILLYSAQMGCLDFITKDDDCKRIKERLSVCTRLHSVSNKVKAAERVLQRRRH